MKIDDILLGRRVRQNHAIEHATFTILGDTVPDLSASARSSSDGFIIFGDVDLGVLRHAIDEAIRRLQAGEAELAIHPNCGTNLAVGVSIVTIGTLLALATSNTRTRLATAAAASLAGWSSARPLGEYVQRHFTTLPEVEGARVTDISRYRVLGMTFINVRTTFDK